MKLNYPKKWFENRIALEGDAEIGAGIPPGAVYARHLARPNVAPVNTRISFGTFVTLWRRNQGWVEIKLAETAGLELKEIIEIEQDSQCEPQPQAIHKLAELFGLSPKPLLRLVGVAKPGTLVLREVAVRFPSHSQSVAALNEREREAFEAFVSTISETPHQD